MATYKHILVPTDGSRRSRKAIRATRSRHRDLIVIASHGRSGLRALALGSETMKVLAHSKIPVLVCR